MIEYSFDKTFFLLVELLFSRLEGSIVRDPTSRWYIGGGVIERLGTEAKYYPPYASGKTYVLSRDLAQLLVTKNCFTTKSIHPGPEDVQIGMCVDRLMQEEVRNVSLLWPQYYLILLT